ncbi:hypothetical protein IW150_003306 [Coemansia sp. RSA 2607]|nr:hypothetical protein IW150_003306 [Coemansia sp. RSA 2607]
MLAPLSSKRRRSSDAEMEQPVVVDQELLRLHGGKRLRSSVFGHWKSQMPCSAPGFPQLPSEEHSLPAFTHHSGTAASISQYSHEQQQQHSYHMDGHVSSDFNYSRNGAAESLYCEPLTSAHHHPATTDSASAMATPSLSPESSGNYYDSDGDDNMGDTTNDYDDTDIDPASEYYHINLLLNQLHRERALRQSQPAAGSRHCQ